MAPERLFIDTWGWLVLANDRDPAFSSVAAIRARMSALPNSWITTDYVLDETLTRLFKSTPFVRARRYAEAIFESAQLGLLDIEHITPNRFANAWRLRLRYRDKPRISFTDMTSFVVMQELGLSWVLTEDAHFEHVGQGFKRLP